MLKCSLLEERVNYTTMLLLRTSRTSQVLVHGFAKEYLFYFSLLNARRPLDLIAIVRLLRSSIHTHHAHTHEESVAVEISNSRRRSTPRGSPSSSTISPSAMQRHASIQSCGYCFGRNVARWSPSMLLSRVMDLNLLASNTLSFNSQWFQLLPLRCYTYQSWVSQSSSRRALDASHNVWSIFYLHTLRDLEDIHTSIVMFLNHRGNIPILSLPIEVMVWKASTSQLHFKNWLALNKLFQLQFREISVTSLGSCSTSTMTLIFDYNKPWLMVSPITCTPYIILLYRYS